MTIKIYAYNFTNHECYRDAVNDGEHAMIKLSDSTSPISVLGNIREALGSGSIAIAMTKDGELYDHGIYEA